MANIYSGDTADWNYSNVTRLDLHSFEFDGVDSYASTMIVSDDMSELSGSLLFRGFLSPVQGGLTEGLRCRLEIYSKQDEEQENWEIEKHFIYIKSDRNGIINQEIKTRGGAYSHIYLRLEVLPDAELSLDDTIDLTSFVIHDPGLIGDLAIIRDKVETNETGLSALEQETLNLFNAMTGSMGFHTTIIETEAGGIFAYIHDQPNLEDSMVIATMTEQGWASTTTGWNDGDPAWTYGATFDGSLVMRVVSTVGVNAEWVRLLDNTDAQTKFAELEAGQLVFKETFAEGGTNLFTNPTWGGRFAPDKAGWYSDFLVSLMLSHFAGKTVAQANTEFSGLTIDEIATYL